MFSFTRELRKISEDTGHNPDSQVIKSKILELIEKEGYDPFKVNFEVSVVDGVFSLEAKDDYTKQTLTDLNSDRDKIGLVEVLLNILRENGVVFENPPIWIEREGPSSMEVEVGFKYKTLRPTFILNIKDSKNKVKNLDVFTFKLYFRDSPYSLNLVNQEIIFNNWEDNNWEILDTLAKMLIFNLNCLPEDII